MIIISVGFLGFFAKLFRPSEANVLFDGASLALYTIGAGIYIANIVKGLRSVSAGDWEDPANQQKHSGPLTGEVILGREDSLRVLAASNTILALVLVGVLVLQAGQWYAERKEADEYDQQQQKSGGDEKEEKSASGAKDKISSKEKGSSKKKQQ